MIQLKTDNPLKRLVQFGQSVWYDGLVSPQEFKRFIEEDGVRGATTNPTIFEKALATGAYDETIQNASKDYSDEKIFQTLAVKAVQEIADFFKPLYSQTQGGDGYVSMEVSPFLAYDTDATVRQARELHAAIARPNVMIKVPATAQGIPAIQSLTSEGINVNVTLIFSVERYREVMEAYVAGLESRAASGQSLSGIASVASFFVSRVDAVVDKFLEEHLKIARDAVSETAIRVLLGRAAIANSKIAYREFEQFFSTPRFERLKQKGAGRQRPLWASTGTKNPQYSDVMYVEALIGPDTVNTIPQATLEAYRDHGDPQSRVRDEMAEAEYVLDALTKLGLSLSAVTQKLEDDGVKLFADSFAKLLARITSKRLNNV